MTTSISKMSSAKVTWLDYLELCKPRVVLLMILTAIVGMCLASPTLVTWQVLLFGNLGIGLSAAAAATINHLLEHRLDILMQRTKSRPIAKGSIKPMNAAVFAGILGVLGMYILITQINLLTALLTLLTLVGYAVIYTVYLKHATSQNIVIGGLAGAAPPLLGWVAVTNHVDLQSLLLVLIIFVWTPPHFWSLAINRIEDYKNAKIPMLPVTHGIPYTKVNIAVYSVLLLVVSLLPFIVHMVSWIYLSGCLVLNALFIYRAFKLLRVDDADYALKTFWFSIWYLLLLFVFLLTDHYAFLYVIG